MATCAYLNETNDERQIPVKGNTLKTNSDSTTKNLSSGTVKDSNISISPVSVNSKTLAVNDDLPHILSNISKMYHNDDKKYAGLNDSLDYKIEMYKDICDINQCPTDCRINGLMLALREPALSKFRAHRHDPGMNFDNYHRNRGGYKPGLGQRGVSGRSSPGNSRNRFEEKQVLYNFNNKCYVCGKEECRAWKHDKDSPSLDVQDVQEDDDKTDLYIAETFDVLDFDEEA
ncbi:hypothetical protein EPUL_005477 [Erysiphe pulchra]|uniref:Uncharacterized protein n=1 Tax=Erysiphe pulchra TaxID=225359 RepID=A0A2S4PIQ4_9PEZI|nr:hypothetical protein EPUL_005477 [Erysiphe pulchra]